MFGLNFSDIETIQKVLYSYPQVEEALIFGSRAMGNYKPGSDVDIALKGNVSLENVLSISAELNECVPLPYKFDVLSYSLIDDRSLIEHINQYGKSFYQKR